MSAPANPRAFPSTAISDEYAGMTLRDWFATFAPQPRDADLAIYQNHDRQRNPHNDPHKPPLRSPEEIRAFLAYRHADAMLAERAKAASQ